MLFSTLRPLFGLKSSRRPNVKPEKRRTLLNVERLEDRTTPIVSGLDILSLTSTADTDGGAGGAEHISVVAGSTVTVNFSFTASSTATTGKFDINTSPTTVSTAVTALGSASTGTLSVVIPIGTAAGTYDAHVQVKNGTGAGSVDNETDTSSVVIGLAIIVLDTTTINNDVPVGVVYDGSQHGISSVTVSDSNGVVAGAVVSTTFYDTHGTLDTGDDTALADEPTNAGSSKVVSIYNGDTNHNGSSDTDFFTIGKAAAVISVSGYSVEYDGNVHGLSGGTATGVGGADLSAFITYGVGVIDVPGGLVAWNFDAGANYLTDSGSERVTITPATAVISVIGYSGDYTGTAHGIVSSSATGVGGAAIAGLVIDTTTYTDVPGGAIGWTFSNSNYFGQTGSATVTINPVGSTVTVSWIDGASTSYDGDEHIATASWISTGSDGENAPLSVSYQKWNGNTWTWVSIGAAPTDAGQYRASASFTGDTNHTGSSNYADFTINAISLDQFATATTQGALNIAKDGTLSFAINVSGGIIDGQSVADLFNGATFTLKLANGSGGYESGTMTATATVVDGIVYVKIRMSQTLYTFLKQGLDAGETSAARANWETINLSATSNDSNYTLSADALTRIFKNGNVVFV